MSVLPHAQEISLEKIFLTFSWFFWYFNVISLAYVLIFLIFDFLVLDIIPTSHYGREALIYLFLSFI